MKFKIFNFNYRLLWISIIIVLVLTSCKKEEEKPKPTLNNNQVNLEVSHFWHGKRINSINQEILFGEGQKVKPTSLAVILSNFEFSNGSQKLKPQEQALIISPDKPVRVLSLGNQTIPSNCNQFSFTVGLDSTINYQDPLKLPQNHELFRPDMHWAWNPKAGYKFIRLEAVLNDSIRITYHYAHSKNKVDLRLISQRFFNAVTPIKLKIDWGKLLDNINLVQNKTWMTPPNETEILNQLKFNLQKNQVFTLE
ncbi:MAG: hypothetical protein RML72_08965 [Bacteroidia bacterium]|nr:hypothetical protein [Bacteroidia bacterium]MDW8158986.1 hypothetical protein [Bacteroidia bacterium]